MAVTRKYPADNLDLSHLTNALYEWFLAQDYNCQILKTDDGGILLQIEKQGTWRKFAGMSTALNVVLRQSGSELAVEIGAGKWIDKAAAGVVSLFVLWPLAVTAAFGAWEQSKMPGKVFEFISRYVLTQAAAAPRLVEGTPGNSSAQVDEGGMYYLAVAGVTSGPLPRNQIVSGVRQGQIPRAALVCPVGGQAWVQLDACPEIAGLLHLPPPPPPPPPAF